MNWITEKIKDLVFTLTHPNYWLMNYSYSKIIDDTLNHLMNYYNFEDITKFYATIGGVQFWISNYPYAAFTVKGSSTTKVRPSRRTIRKARDKLLRDFLQSEIDKKF